MFLQINIISTIQITQLVIVFTHEAYKYKNIESTKLTAHGTSSGLLYPGHIAVHRFIFGLGIPVENLRYASITSGVVFKCSFQLPVKKNRKAPYTGLKSNTRSLKRRYITNTSNRLRWSFYKILEIWANKLGFNGHRCVLKSLCEISQQPFSLDSGDILHEIVHILFTPKTSSDILSNEIYIDYKSAANIRNTTCDNVFSDCPQSILSIFTNIFKY